MKIREDFLPLNRPSVSDGDIDTVNRCLRSGWITTGALCKDFEERFMQLTGAPYAVSLSSATAGMHLALPALGIGPGDEVITPSMTFVSTINMIAMAGARPVFVDCDYGTLNINPQRIEEKITGRTKAVIPVHFAGAPADMDPISRMADRHGLTVIEDAAHAVGTYYKGIHAGGFGRIAIFSFHPIKNITAGEGGMLTHFDEHFEKKIRLLRFHGIERDAWKRYGKGGNPDYDVAMPGFKYNLTDIQAALGISQFDRVGAFNRRRSELARLYREGACRPGGDRSARSARLSARSCLASVCGQGIGHGPRPVHDPPERLQYRLRPSISRRRHLMSYVRERFGTAAGMLPGNGEGGKANPLAAPVPGHGGQRCVLCM